MNLSPKARIILYNLQFIDSNLKNKGIRSLSKFISGLIVEFGLKIKPEMAYKLILSELHEATAMKEKYQEIEYKLVEQLRKEKKEIEVLKDNGTG